MTIVASLLRGVPAKLPQELIETLAGTGEVRIERIVSRGHTSPPDFWYDQPEHEFVVLIKGEAHLEFDDDGQAVVLVAGDWLVIPAHKRHRVAWTDPGQETIWLAVHYRCKADGVTP